MAKGICALICVPTHFVAAPLAIFVSPRTLWEIDYVELLDLCLRHLDVQDVDT